MKSKKFASANCYTLITLAFLFGSSSVLLFRNSSIYKRSLQTGDIFGILTNGTPPHSNNTSTLNNDENLNNSTYPESETIPINQNKTLASNFKKSNDQAKRNRSDILLYRKRRYLVFPEGSSFQIVFDLIIPIVDYTNYAIMGITCAVAWELPSKPPSGIEEDFVNKLNDGTYGLSRNDSVNNIQYIDTPQRQKLVKDHISKIIYIQPSEYGYQRPSYSQTHAEYTNLSRYRPVYNASGQVKPIYYTKNYGNPAPFKLKSINNERNDIGILNNVPSPLKPSRRPPTSRQRIFRPQQHAVYHIMGKRSTPPTADRPPEELHPAIERLESIHLQYHRSSRLQLYSKIEVMFENQGKNGTECVRKALCEFGQQRHENEPRKFLSEILRVIFTLPKAEPHMHHDTLHHKHKAWDEAHWTTHNCTKMYPSCKDLSWSNK